MNDTAKGHALDRLPELLSKLDSSLRQSYILEADEQLPYALGMWATGGLNYTRSNLDLVAQPELERRGVWRGRGFCCVLQPRATFSTPDSLVSVGIHEAAHFAQVVGPDDLRAEVTEPAREYAKTLRIEKTEQEVAESYASSTRVAPWHLHGLDFIRAYSHLLYRSERAGTFVKPTFHCSSYGLSSFKLYYGLLSRELRTRVNDPIKEIVASPLNDAVKEVFLIDTRAFWEDDLFAANERVAVAYRQARKWKSQKLYEHALDAWRARESLIDQFDIRCMTRHAPDPRREQSLASTGG